MQNARPIAVIAIVTVATTLAIVNATLVVWGWQRSAQSATSGLVAIPADALSRQASLPDDQSPTLRVGLVPPGPGETALAWSIVRCAAGERDECTLAASTASAYEQTGKQVRLCALVDKSAECLEIRTPHDQVR